MLGLADQEGQLWRERLRESKESRRMCESENETRAWLLQEEEWRVAEGWRMGDSDVEAHRMEKHYAREARRYYRRRQRPVRRLEQRFGFDFCFFSTYLLDQVTVFFGFVN